MISQKVNELADIVYGTQYVSASMWFWICVSIFIQSNIFKAIDTHSSEYFIVVWVYCV